MINYIMVIYDNSDFFIIAALVVSLVCELFFVCNARRVLEEAISSTTDDKVEEANSSTTDDKVEEANSSTTDDKVEETNSSTTDDKAEETNSSTTDDKVEETNSKNKDVVYLFSLFFSFCGQYWCRLLVSKFPEHVNLIKICSLIIVFGGLLIVRFKVLQKFKFEKDLCTVLCLIIGLSAAFSVVTNSGLILVGTLLLLLLIIVWSLLAGWLRKLLESIIVKIHNSANQNNYILDNLRFFCVCNTILEFMFVFVYKERLYVWFLIASFLTCICIVITMMFTKLYVNQNEKNGNSVKVPKAAHIGILYCTLISSFWCVNWIFYNPLDKYPKTPINIIYYTLVSVTTVGLGDMAATTWEQSLISSVSSIMYASFCATLISDIIYNKNNPNLKKWSKIILGIWIAGIVISFLILLDSKSLKPDGFTIQSVCEQSFMYVIMILSSIGYGNILPETCIAKAVTCLLCVCSTVLNVGLIAIVYNIFENYATNANKKSSNKNSK